MNWQHYTSAFILGTIATIFSYDTIADIFGQHATISEVITNWINASPTHLVIFIGAVASLCTHFVWGYYNK